MARVNNTKPKRKSSKLNLYSTVDNYKQKEQQASEKPSMLRRDQPNFTFRENQVVEDAMQY